MSSSVKGGAADVVGVVDELALLDEELDVLGPQSAAGVFLGDVVGGLAEGGLRLALHPDGVAPLEAVLEDVLAAGVGDERQQGECQAEQRRKDGPTEASHVSQTSMPPGNGRAVSARDATA